MLEQKCGPSGAQRAIDLPNFGSNNGPSLLLSVLCAAGIVYFLDRRN